MVVVLFRSRLTGQAGDDYQQMAAEMYNSAKAMPGFIDFKSYKAEDGERISVVWWKDEETLKLWRETRVIASLNNPGAIRGTRTTRSRSPK